MSPLNTTAFSSIKSDVRINVQIFLIFDFFSWRDTVHSNENFPEAQLLRIDKIEAALFKVGVGLVAELTTLFLSIVYDPKYKLNVFSKPYRERSKATAGRWSDTSRRKF